MSEEEKMLAGEIYDGNYNKELLEKRLIAKELCKKFNECDTRETEEKKKILEKLFQKKIDIMTIEPNFYCDYGFNIFLGKNFYSNHNLIHSTQLFRNLDNTFSSSLCIFCLFLVLDYLQTNSNVFF